MSDAEAPQTRLFNRTTQPRVLDWGSGVVMPGESFKTDHPESFAPDTPGSAWTVDSEAAAALVRSNSPIPTSPPASPADGLSGVQDAPQVANTAPPGPVPETVEVEPNGEIRNDQGVVIGYVNQAAEAATNPTQEQA